MIKSYSISGIGTVLFLGKSCLLFYGKQGTCKMEHQLSVLSHMIGKNRLNLMFKRTLEK